MSNQGKVVLITGSSSGIGAATAKLLSKEGYKVVVTGSKKEKVDRVVAQCTEVSPTKSKPLGLVLDLKEPSNGEVAVNKTVEHFGQLNVLVNNAGIFTRTLGDDATTYDTYREVMTINTDATVKATLAAVPHLKATKGNLIFMSSVASVKASEKGYAYCMSKAAMSMFAKCLAIDLAPSIRVNIVSPGPVKTPIFERVGFTEDQAALAMSYTTLQNRIGDVDEIAKSVSFLISDDASFINGHELFIDGGYLLKPSAATASQALGQAKK